MRLLHTADWHIGRLLYGKRRYEEMEKFLAWLEGTIVERKVSTLLIAGDVFENSTPSNQAQELYYRFLGRMASLSCHVVVIAGNHDSPALLDAPSKLLGMLDIHVRGQVGQDELVLLKDKRGKPELIVCAVPFLHDRDIRTIEGNNDFTNRQFALTQGIIAHYDEVIERARELQDSLPGNIPIVIMGHLHIRGGETLGDDGVRDLYVGTPVLLDADFFPPDAAYTALGHIHIPQKMGETVYYSGSPIPMGFGEANQQKYVCLVDVKPGKPASVETIPIPVFRRLERVWGDWEDIENRLDELMDAGEPAWLEVRYQGKMELMDMRGRIESILQGHPELELLSSRDEAKMKKVLEQFHGDVGLDTLSPDDVFERLLEIKQVPEEERDGLRVTYGEALNVVELGDADI